MDDNEHVLRAAVTQWLDWDKNDVTREEIKQMLAEKNWEALESHLLHRMSFGTAGLRARMGAGYSQMNDLTIIQTTQVYSSNGAQIVTPHDKLITKGILESLEPWKGSWNTDILQTSELCSDPSETVYAGYNKELQALRYTTGRNNTPVTFTYTAMHGVGYKAILAAFHAFGFSPPIAVKEQVEADPDFPTVKFPNPEEGESALDMAISTAEANNSRVILANDPDADRLAVAERHGDGWKVFTGNETGALLGWWLWTNWRKQHPDVSASDVFMLASTVSSKILSAIAAKEGFQFEETLTGFKWMGNRSCELQKEGKIVLFAFEEAIGYMCGTAVLDKDGVSAAAVCAELATYLYQGNRTLLDLLQEIYETYGHHLTLNSYYFCYNPNNVVSMFDFLRNYNGEGKYPDTCGPYKICGIRDLTTGYDNTQPNNKATLPSSSSSQMITFTFENGVVMTLRTSGTEPKVKYYAEYCATPESKANRNYLERELNDLVENVIERFMNPGKYGMVPRSA